MFPCVQRKAGLKALFRIFPPLELGMMFPHLQQTPSFQVFPRSRKTWSLDGHLCYWTLLCVSTWDGLLNKMQKRVLGCSHGGPVPAEPQHGPVGALGLFSRLLWQHWSTGHLKLMLNLVIFF